jgi:hypothetical protein
MFTSQLSRARCGLLAAGLALALAPSPAPAAGASHHFTVGDAGRLSLNGTAMLLSDGRLRLTGGGFRQAGSAWADDEVDLTKSFGTSFLAFLHGRDSADGIAFLVQAVGPRALGGWGGGLGYRGIRPSVAVELDDFHNATDPPGDHVGVVLRGNPDYHLATAAPAVPLFGRPVDVQVSYDAPSHNLKVYVGGAALLDQTVDLAGQLGGDRAWLGFTGATGDATSYQDVLVWSVTSS